MKHNAPTYQLAVALTPLTEALRNLQECAREHRCFVILEDTVTGRFVQFSGSAIDPLWFDAPQLGVVNSGPKFEDAEEAAEYAIEQMGEKGHHLPNIALVMIVFDSTQEERPS